MVLQQYIAPTVNHFDHGVVRQLVAEHFMKTRIKMAQVFGQSEIAAPATVIKQLVRLRSMVPVGNVVHQQQALQVAAQAR